MLMRTIAALAFVALTGSGLFAQQNDASAKVGDRLVIQMTGDLARQYVRCMGALSVRENGVPAGLSIEAIAMVRQELGNGRSLIEHSAQSRLDGSHRLVTLTAIVDSPKVTTDVTPKGALIYPSPAAHTNGTPPVTTKDDTKTMRLQLSELKGVQLRLWKLAEEVGD